MFPHTVPKSGFTGYGFGALFTEKDIATSHNVAATSEYAKTYPVGTVIKYFNAALNGYGACAYMICDEASTDAIVVGDCVTLKAGSHTILTNDASAGAVGDYAAEGGFPAAIAISAMTTDYLGWFWIMGVCPDLNTAASTLLSANTGITSAGSIGAMSSFTASTTDGAIALFNNDGTADAAVIGMSLAADSSNANTFSNVRLDGIGWGV